jgi:hypothetical protein
MNRKKESRLFFIVLIAIAILSSCSSIPLNNIEALHNSGKYNDITAMNIVCEDTTAKCVKINAITADAYSQLGLFSQANQYANLAIQLGGGNLDIFSYTEPKGFSVDNFTGTPQYMSLSYLIRGYSTINRSGNAKNITDMMSILKDAEKDVLKGIEIALQDEVPVKNKRKRTNLLFGHMLLGEIYIKMSSISSIWEGFVRYVGKIKEEADIIKELDNTGITNYYKLYSDFLVLSKDANKIKKVSLLEELESVKEEAVFICPKVSGNRVIGSGCTILLDKINIVLNKLEKR